MSVQEQTPLSDNKACDEAFDASTAAVMISANADSNNKHTDDATDITVSNTLDNTDDVAEHTQTEQPPFSTWPRAKASEQNAMTDKDEDNTRSTDLPENRLEKTAAVNAQEASLPPEAETAFDTKTETTTVEEEHPMSMMEHLGELRTRLMRCFIGAVVGFFLCYGVAEPLFAWLSAPLATVLPQDTRLIYTSVPEGFFVYLKVAAVAGLFLTSPYIFYQIWAFVAPGLYREERRVAIPLAFCSAFFFIGGAAFCYFVVFPFAFTFFMSYSTGMIVAMPSISEYLGFSLKMLIAFGLIFEMPLFAFFLARIGILGARQMRRIRKYAVLAMFVVAAVLTPPDLFSQLLMAVPLLILYEISIVVAVFAQKKPAAETTQGTETKENIE